MHDAYSDDCVSHDAANRMRTSLLAHLSLKCLFHRLSEPEFRRRRRHDRAFSWFCAPVLVVPVENCNMAVVQQLWLLQVRDTLGPVAANFVAWLGALFPASCSPFSLDCAVLVLCFLAFCQPWQTLFPIAKLTCTKLTCTKCIMLSRVKASKQRVECAAK
jgi:hypothetical protein